MAGLSDILGAYRQGLASERQMRSSEMQMELATMKMGAEKEWRESERKRQDVLSTLDFASQSANEALSRDASLSISKLMNIEAVSEYADYGENGLENPNKVVKKLVKSGFNDTDAKQITGIISAFNSSNEQIRAMSIGMASDFSQRVARDYNFWKSTGYGDEYTTESGGKSSYKSKLMKSLIKNKVIYGGTDTGRIDMSASAFLGVSGASEAIGNIKRERLQIAEGDYDVQSPISKEGVSSLSQLSDAFMQLYNKGTNIPEELVETEKPDNLPSFPNVKDDSDIMESLSFLPEEESKAIESKLSSLSSLVSDKEKELSSLMGKRELILNEYEDAKSSSKKVLKRMRYFDKIGDDDKVRSLSKEFDKLNRIIKGNTKSGLEMRASKMAKWTPQGITSGQYYQDSVTKEILDLSNEIHVLNSQRNKLGG